eukprot:JP446790.1.p5 GENE.JP446790.1~~JP446790.1.p5  ORF type:complete len:56 (+),score=2.13 JP446790.1:268-435(+)
MHASIHNQPARTPHLENALAKKRGSFLVESHFQTQRLGIQPPSFTERRMQFKTRW